MDAALALGGSPAVAASAPAPTHVDAAQIPRTVPLGIPSLDAFLEGGIPAGALVLVVGPPLCGKAAIARQFLAHARAAACRSLAALTDGVPVWQRALATNGDVTARAQPTPIRLLDLMAPPSGAPELPHARPNQKEAAPEDRSFTALRQAVEQAGPAPRVVFSSLSNLIGFTDRPTILVLMRLVAELRRNDATGLILADAGAHTATELERIKHHVDGVVEFRRHDDAPTKLRVVGLGLRAPSPWVPYEISRGSIRITGSWNGGRIAAGRMHS